EKGNISNQSWCDAPAGTDPTFTPAGGGKGCNPFFWVHHQSQGMITSNQPINWTRSNSRAAQGDHSPGGVMASFCDWHVVFLSNNIPPPIYPALGTRNGNEAVSPP